MSTPNDAHSGESKSESHSIASRARYTRIDSFRGPYDYLSHDYSSSVLFDDQIFPSAIDAMLYAKYNKELPENVNLFSDVNTTDWEECTDWRTNRLEIVDKILRDKFRRNADLRKQLQDTGHRELVQSSLNELRDEESFWCENANGEGRNYMGRALMNIRQSLFENKELQEWLRICQDLEVDLAGCPTISLVEHRVTDTAIDLSATNDKIVHLSGKAFHTIGKLDTSDVQALHPSISRTHALIAHTKKGVQIYDLASKAGTFLNKKQLPEHFTGYKLRQGDVLSFGGSSRQYAVQVDLTKAIAFLEQQRRDVRQQLVSLDEMGAPGEKNQSTATTVWVGNLTYTCTRDQLREFLNSCGEILDVRFPSNRDGPRNDDQAGRGIAFVTLQQMVNHL
eukprot:GHVL01022864.1.p1 GENE.GHVL01022864.1~~GHVL01022864.1.p1  ORF type:complete len:394 (-),score=59.91 GHVL01022864.1:2092-3273(-)